MLGDWLDHKSYISFVQQKVLDYEEDHKATLWRGPSERALLERMLYFDVDLFYPIIKALYPCFGRPSHFQDRILRSFALFTATNGGNNLGRYKGIDNWIEAIVPNNPFLLTLVGCATAEEYPEVGSHYDFINRLWLGDRIRYSRDARYSARMNYGTKYKIGNDNKVIDTEFSVADMMGILGAGEQLSANNEMAMQQMLGLMAVIPSMNSGCIPEVCCGNVDSTAYYEHANQYGKCKCSNARIGCEYKSECGALARFSCPDGRVGFDSGEGCFFFGQHLHVLTVRNKKCGIDLPVSFTLADAQRHDAVVFPVLYQEMSYNIPTFHMDYFAGDSAYDHPPIYDFLLEEGTIPLIALNTNSMSYKGLPKGFKISAKGYPVCPAKKEMIFVDNDEEDKCWLYACPMKPGTAEVCSHKDKCPCCINGPEALRINPKDSSRFFTVIPRDCDEFKDNMGGRSASERLNKRGLKDYNLDRIMMRNADHRSFLVAIAAINVHIDAWLKMRLLPPGVTQEQYVFLTGKQLPHLQEIRYVDTTIPAEVTDELIARIRSRRTANATRQKQVDKVREDWKKFCAKKASDWECPQDKAKRMMQTGEDQVLEKDENQEGFIQLELLPYESHSVKCWEVPYMDSLPSDLIIDYKGTAYKEEKPVGKFKGYEMIYLPGQEREQNGFKEIRKNVWYRKAPSPFKAGTMAAPRLYGEDYPDEPTGVPEFENVNDYVPPELYNSDRGDAPYGRPWTSAKEQPPKSDMALGNTSTPVKFLADETDKRPVVPTGGKFRNPKWCNLPKPRKGWRRVSVGRNIKDRSDEKIA